MVKRIPCRIVSISIIISLLLNVVVHADMPSFKNNTNIDYANPQSEVIGEGSNVWNTNYIKGTGVFPLKKAWEVSVGLSDCKPLIIDDLIFVLADSSIQGVKKETGEVLAAFDLNNQYPLFQPGSLFGYKIDDNTYQIIGVSDDQVVSITAIAQKDENGQLSTLTFDSSIGGYNWSYTPKKTAQIANKQATKFVTRAISLIQDANENINVPFYTFGTYSGQIVAIDGETGDILTQGEHGEVGILGSGSPVVYPSANGRFSEVIYIGNDSASSKSYFKKAHVLNGQFFEDSGLDSSMIFDAPVDELTAPVAFTYTNDLVEGGTQPTLIAQEKNGTIIGYNPKKKKILFRIDAYKGSMTANQFTVKGKYIVATLANQKNDHAAVICIDMKRAIEEAQFNDYYLANDAVLFSKELDGKSYIGTTALSVVSQNEETETTHREIFLAADQEGTISMYYLDKYNSESKVPVEVPYGFSITDQEGNESTVSNIQVSSGIVSELSYAAGYLVFIDGSGLLQAYTAVTENNLALVNMQNSSDTLQRGQTYKCVVDVVNYTGEDQKNVDMEFYINDMLVHKSPISFGVDGVSVYFQYTVPPGFTEKEVRIRSQLNMDESNRTLEEITYEDNVQEYTWPVLDEIDLSISNLQYSSYPAGQRVSAICTVTNNSDSEVHNVPVKLSISYGGNSDKVKMVSLLPNSEETLSFSFTTPDKDTTIGITAEVNHTRVITEKSYANNKTQIQADIVKNLRPSDCEKTRRWTEWEARTEYDSEGNAYTVWYRFVYEASISLNVALDTNRLKSGYGFEVAARGEVSYKQVSGAWPRSPRDKPDAPNQALVLAEFLSDTTTMDRSSGSGLVRNFVLPQNPESPYRYRKLYTPVELEGNSKDEKTYTVQVFVAANSPGGKLCTSLDLPLTIYGDMYEDYYNR